MSVLRRLLCSTVLLVSLAIGGPALAAPVGYGFDSGFIQVSAGTVRFRQRLTDVTQHIAQTPLGVNRLTPEPITTGNFHKIIRRQNQP